MHCLSIGGLASIVLLALANVSAIATEQCGDISASTGLPGHTHQCSATSKTNIDDSVLAVAGEHKSCVSECVEDFSICKTSRARDCRLEYKTCSWTCGAGAKITIN